MTIPARGRLLLHRVTDKRPPQHSDEGKGAGFGVQTQSFSSERPLGLEIGPRFGRMAVWQAVKGDSRIPCLAKGRNQ